MRLWATLLLLEPGACCHPQAVLAAYAAEQLDCLRLEQADEQDRCIAQVRARWGAAIDELR